MLSTPKEINIYTNATLLLPSHARLVSSIIFTDLRCAVIPFAAGPCLSMTRRPAFTDICSIDMMALRQGHVLAAFTPRIVN